MHLSSSPPSLPTNDITQQTWSTTFRKHTSPVVARIPHANRLYMRSHFLVTDNLDLLFPVIQQHVVNDIYYTGPKQTPKIINLMVVLISQSIQISNHHIIHFKHILFYLSVITQ